MRRRAFLGSLAALTAGMALDPERLLWVPGRTSYFDIQRPDKSGRALMLLAERARNGEWITVYENAIRGNGIVMNQIAAELWGMSLLTEPRPKSPFTLRA